MYLRDTLILPGKDRQMGFAPLHSPFVISLLDLRVSPTQVAVDRVSLVYPGEKLHWLGSENGMKVTG